LECQKIFVWFAFSFDAFSSQTPAHPAELHKPPPRRINLQVFPDN
jgi:hypothetical protein